MPVDHPIRSLVCPEIEEPIGKVGAGGERRRSPRYARRLPGRLRVGDRAMAITCVDIGYGGVGVVTAGPTAVGAGEETELEIRLGTRVFRDRFSVVHARSSDEGTHVHLRV